MHILRQWTAKLLVFAIFAIANISLCHPFEAHTDHAHDSGASVALTADTHLKDTHCQKVMASNTTAGVNVVSRAGNMQKMSALAILPSHISTLVINSVADPTALLASTDQATSKPATLLILRC